MVYVSKQKKEEEVLEGFAETIQSKYGKAKKILVDTGPQEGKYRVIANLKRMVCPECGVMHYSTPPEKTCLECTFILKEERRLGRKMTPQEKINFLRRLDL